MSYKDLQQPILFFDGICNLCTGAVQFVMRHDKHKLFLFASLQSQAGEHAIRETGIALPNDHGTIILYYRGQYYLRSSAIIKTAQLLGGVWSLADIFRILPTWLRDGIYKFVARNRYKWFGKRNECLLPTPENKARFIG
jgi:predicted DCC family thiol-disulfide oxidoreductase YuxK